MNIFEIDALLQKSQYKRAFKLLQKNEFTDSNRANIGMARRYTYCCRKLVDKYMLKFTSKSHRVQQFLYLSFEALQIWNQLLQIENQFIEIRSLRRLGSISSLIDSSPYVQKQNTRWLQKQRMHYFQAIVVTLMHFYQWSRKQGLFQSRFLQYKLSQMSQFIQGLRKHTRLDNISLYLKLLLNNAYIEGKQFSLSVDYLQEIISKGIATSILPLIKDKDKGKQLVDSPKFIKGIKHNCQIIILALDSLATNLEQLDSYAELLQTLQFSDFVCTLLIYIKKSQELVSYIYARREYLYQRYQQHISEIFELTKITEQIYDYKQIIKQRPFKIETSYEQLLRHFKYDVNGKQFININNDLEDNVDQLIIHKNMLSECQSVQDTTIVSHKHTRTEIKLNESNGLTSITINSKPTEFINSRLSIHRQKLLKKSSAQNYLSELLRMKIHPARSNPNFSRTTSQHQQFQLDDQMKKYVISDHQSYDHQYIQQAMQLEQDLAKEIPVNYQMLKFKQEFGNGGTMIKEGVTEFNKHFEFNFMKYFDYLTSNKVSAMAKISDNKNFIKLRLAEQKLLQSQNLVIKEELQQTSERKLQDKSAQIDLEAGVLMQKSQQGKFTTIAFQTARVQNHEMYEKQSKLMKQAFQKQLISVALDDQNIELPSDQVFQFKEVQQQRALQKYHSQFETAQQEIKELLSEKKVYSEQTFRNKQSLYKSYTNLSNSIKMQTQSPKFKMSTKNFFKIKKQ